MLLYMHNSDGSETANIQSQRISRLNLKISCFCIKNTINSSIINENNDTVVNV